VVKFDEHGRSLRQVNCEKTEKKVREKQIIRVFFFTHDIHLPNRIHENDGEDGDGESQREALRDVPVNPLEPGRHDEHENSRNPHEGGEEEQQKDEGSGQSGDLQGEEETEKP
jgi:hypothetical protein